MMPHPDDHLEYYRRELRYLRTESANFAARYPKLARRLVLGDADMRDPHIQHLIESVAFLTAGVHRELDSVLPTAASAILENLCPSLAQPVPSMTVMQMTLDPAEGKVTVGSQIARGTLLTATAASGEPCRFQVGWNTTLWPLRVGDVVKEDARTLRIDMHADAGVDLADLEIDYLRLHLAGELLTTMPLQDLMLTSLCAIDVVSTHGVQHMPVHALRAVGFGADELMLANPAHVHPAYSLLQAYFAFPRIFQFFDLGGLRGKLGTGSMFSLRLTFTHGAAALALLGPDNIRLNCVPAINLFSVTSEPVAYDQRHYEYLLVPNRQRDTTTEVHSILSVTVSDPRSERSEVVTSAFAASGDRDDAPLAWTMRRAVSLRPGIVGTDLYLSFVDRRDPTAPHGEPVVYANLLCTNRQLASQVAPGARFYGAGMAASTAIRALYQPSAQRPPPQDSETLWALVALLRLNHRALVDGSSGVGALRAMLTLFAGDSAGDAAQIRGIRSVSAAPGTARIGGKENAGAWRGHCRGTDIVIAFDPDAFAGASALMFASVLAHFFALYTTANSFVRLSVQRDGETWMDWPPMTGRQALL